MSELQEAAMSLSEARRVTERIRVTAMNVREGLEKLQDYVESARQGLAWQVLGYKSWTAYLADVMGEEPLRLSRDERREVVELLAGEGMSTRAIAPIVGASQRTVADDVKAREQICSPAPTASVVSVPGPVAQESTSDKAADGTAKVAVPGSQDGEDHMGASDVGDGHVDPSGISRPAVTGMDGKTYPRTSPGMKSRRTPLIRTIEAALLDLDRRSTTLLGTTEDDRWDDIKNQVASTRASDLDRIINRLTTVRQSLK